MKKKSIYYNKDKNQINPYERAIQKCEKILGFFDYNQEFPVYGFGAIANSKISHCFNINFQNNPNISSIEEIILLYRECLNKISFSNVTYLSQIINKIIEEIIIQNSPKEYKILLLFTNGKIDDIQNTIDSLVEASYYPLSVIIIGIGNGDFSEIEKLDEDKRDNIPLISRQGLKSQRDLVKFIPFSKFEENEEKLECEILEKILRQIIEYYTLNFMYPEEFKEEKEKINIRNDNILTDKIPKTIKDEGFKNLSFFLFDNNKINKKESQNIEQDNYYSEINRMFKKNIPKIINKDTNDLAIRNINNSDNKKFKCIHEKNFTSYCSKISEEEGEEGGLLCYECLYKYHFDHISQCIPIKMNNFENYKNFYKQSLNKIKNNLKDQFNNIISIIENYEKEEINNISSLFEKDIDLNFELPIEIPFIERFEIAIKRKIFSLFDKILFNSQLNKKYLNIFPTSLKDLNITKNNPNDSEIIKLKSSMDFNLLGIGIPKISNLERMKEIEVKIYKGDTLLERKINFEYYNNLSLVNFSKKIYIQKNEEFSIEINGINGFDYIINEKYNDKSKIQINSNNKESILECLIIE